MEPIKIERKPGYLVETRSGKGRTYHSEHLVNGKVIVHLVDERGMPIVENGKAKKILCDRAKVKLIGYVD